MKALRYISIFVLMLVFGCGSTADIVSEFDETVDFDSYTTFVLCIDDLFVENTQYPKYDNNTVRELLGEAVEAQMIEKGHKTNVLNPQLQAGFQLIVEEKEATFTNCEHQDEYSYWEECTIDTIVYTEETLVVYVSDFERKQIIWQASVECDMNRTGANLKDYVKELVIKLFNEYPKI
ncbi:MAG: DUF4136 domain-containing protein [Flavobacteriaceae bacterium]|nr:DUF4136 domain-containing protein [Flavobacteriaceae bacterium]